MYRARKPTFLSTRTAAVVADGAEVYSISKPTFAAAGVVLRIPANVGQTANMSKYLLFWCVLSVFAANSPASFWFHTALSNVFFELVQQSTLDYEWSTRISAVRRYSAAVRK